MKRIVISGEAGKKMIENIKKAKEESKKRMEERMPPDEVMKWMKDKADETDKINGGTLDKSTFMLGMMAMWSYMNKKNEETEK